MLSADDYASSRESGAPAAPQNNLFVRCRPDGKANFNLHQMLLDDTVCVVAVS